MRRTASGLIIPTRMNEEPRFRCNVCGHPSYNEREQIAHAKEHAADEDLMHALTYSPTEAIMGEGDPEYMRYLKDRHAQLKKEHSPKDALDPKRY